MKKIQERLKGLSPPEQLEVMADLLNEVAEQMRETVVEARADHVVAQEARERRRKDRDDRR